MNKSIYISRPVLNKQDIQNWMVNNNFNTCIEDLHVTIGFDAKDHNWDDVPKDYNEQIIIKDVDDRSVEVFNSNIVVLEFESLDLTMRWAELLNYGLHWKWDEYRPHIALTYYPNKNIETASIQPFDDIIILGEEIIVEAHQGHSIKESRLTPFQLENH